MNPEITINISMAPEGATISKDQTTMGMGEAPGPLPLEESEAMGGMEEGEAPEPVPLEELEVMAGAPSPEETPKPEESGGSKRKAKG